MLAEQCQGPTQGLRNQRYRLKRGEFPHSSQPHWHLSEQRAIGDADFHQVWKAAGKPTISLGKGPAAPTGDPEPPSRAEVLQAFGIEDEATFLEWAAKERRERRKARQPLGEDWTGSSSEAEA